MPLLLEIRKHLDELATMKSDWLDAYEEWLDDDENWGNRDEMAIAQDEHDAELAARELAANRDESATQENHEANHPTSLAIRKKRTIGKSLLEEGRP